jgi:hypothetical protein
MVHNKTSLDGGVAFGTWFRLGSRAGFISFVAGMRGPIGYICYVCCMLPLYGLCWVSM